MGNIVLIGMPGAGKSTIGVILAKVLGYKFIDTDLLIQESEKRLLQEIIEQDGIEKFLEIESRINSTLNIENAVIATGGSVVYKSEAMEHLRSIGKILYLKLSYEELATRLGNLVGRGVVLKEGQSLKNLYEERIQLYEKYAQITIEEEGLNVEETLEQILKSI
jgi:Shikimate kinase